MGWTAPDGIACARVSSLQISLKGEPTNPKAPIVDQYARAREVQANCLPDDIITIADESRYDQTFDDDGKPIVIRPTTRSYDRDEDDGAYLDL
jgi:hypothetical protein